MTRAPLVRRRSTAMLALLLALLPGRVAGQEVEAKEPNRGGALNLEALDPAVALQRLRPGKGYEVSLFASERDFPIGNPVAMAFDSRGRLWVSTMPSYPHYRPGDPPTDKLIILEDTDGDGAADRHTVFADSLYLALGFELGDGGVYISQQPNLVFLRDTDGDDVADERRVVLHGFGTEDSHHAISAFTWGPGGGLYFQEGTFHHSQVETPYGTVRLKDAGIFRYEPHTQRLGVFVSYPFANPWGHVFDRWGQSFIADASSGHNYFGLPITGHLDYPLKHQRMRVFTSIVRPTAGAEIVRSRHFPDDVQGNLLITNVIGFHGIKSHRVTEDGSGFTSAEAEPLLTSTDINFRPIDLEFGPDGALYVVDWFNPLIGHMQYSLRDPRRDREHGRIWRLTHKERPLLQPIDLAERSTAQLLELLKAYEDRTRYRVRRELRERDREEVRRELARWVAGLNPSDAGYEHQLLEALWVHQSRDLFEPELLGRLLRADDPRARAAATRVLRFWIHHLADPLEPLRRQVNDPHPRVRLEAVVALSHVPSAEAAEIALEALRHPRDYYLDYGLRETLTGLEKHWKPVLTSGRPFAADNPEGVLFLLDRLGPQEVAKVMRSEPVNRELLRRGGVASDVRRQAMRDLAALRGTTPGAELMEAIRSVDGDAEAGGAGADLAALLAEVPATELRALRPQLVRLATGAREPRLRQGGYAALLRADGRVERAWRLASASESGLEDLLGGMAALDDPGLRDALYPRVRSLLRDLLAGPAGTAEGGVRGRYVRVEQPGCCETLSLAEVEVLDGHLNLASGGRAEQKSTASGGEAKRAIDGDIRGDFREGSVSQSNVMEADPWWELDLGEERSIGTIRIWKRTDDQLGEEMSGFHLRVLGSDRRPVFVREKNDAAAQPIVFTLGGDRTQALRRAAVRALAGLPGREAERLAVFGDLLRRGIDPDLAIAGVGSILESGWRGGDLGALAEQLLAHAGQIPPTDRSGPTFSRAVELVRSLTAALPADRAARLTASLEALLPRSVRIRALEGEMKFDLGSFAVAAGQEVELVFENPDHMPHNVVVTLPGALEKVGRAADAMATQQDAFARHFVPDLPEVVVATPLIGAGESFTLRFRAPTEPGEYPFICTFPGHWLTMRGTLRVEPRPTGETR